MSWKKVLIGFIALAFLIFAFLTWYKYYYAMGVTESFEVNTPEREHSVLIATQGSEFKDVVVAGIVDHLKQQTYIKVIDVTELAQVNEDHWNAVIVIHTWEMQKPQADAKTFIERARDLSKVIVLSTSGDGDFKMEGVDAISSASVMENAPARILDITMRLDAILREEVK